MVIAFILLLLLAIWLAFKFGGVRKADKRGKGNANDSATGSSGADSGEGPNDVKGGDVKGGDFRGGGGLFGGGGASDSWGNDGGSGDGGGGD